MAQDQPALRQPVDEPHGAVMLELQAFGKLAYGRLAGICFDGQEQLMLGRLQAGAPGGLLAKTQEAADLVAELGQGLVVGRAQV